jgi:hypothetical protein
MNKISIALISFSLGLISCQGDSGEQNMAKDAINQEKQETEKINAIDLEELNSLIGSIPPPVLVANMISEGGYKYDSKLLCSVEKMQKYTDSYKQAFGLGVYGTDLAYTQVFEQAPDGMVYFQTVFKLSESLQIEHLFDKVTIERLNQSNNIDSLLNISTSNMEKANKHFIEQKRPAMSALILLGSWLEGNYLLSEIYKKNPSDKLKEKIAEQEVSVEILEQIIKKFEHDQDFNNFSKELKPLFENFVKVDVVEKELESGVKNQVSNDGVVKAIETTETQIVVDKKEFEELIKIIGLTRNKLIL